MKQILANFSLVLYSCLQTGIPIFIEETSWSELLLFMILTISDILNLGYHDSQIPYHQDHRCINHPFCDNILKGGRGLSQIGVKVAPNLEVLKNVSQNTQTSKTRSHDYHISYRVIFSLVPPLKVPSTKKLI